MMHSKRVFRVYDAVYGAPIDTPLGLARVLTEHDWCTCNGFKLGHLVFLNDSTGPDGAQEYAVFDTRNGRQIESLTVSWMKRDVLAEVVTKLLAEPAEEGSWTMPSFEHPDGYCYACA